MWSVHFEVPTPEARSLANLLMWVPQDQFSACKLKGILSSLLDRWVPLVDKNGGFEVSVQLT